MLFYKHKRNKQGTKMEVFENLRLRVTVPDTVTASKNDVLTTAMRSLEHMEIKKKLIETGPVFNNFEIINTIKKDLIYDYLCQSCRYDPNDLFNRWATGRIMGPGQEADIQQAESYARGFVSPMNDGEIAAKARDFMETNPSKPESFRFFNNLFKEKECTEKAEKLAQLYNEQINIINSNYESDIEYSNRRIDFISEWYVEIIGEMPAHFPQSGSYGKKIEE